MREYLFRGKTDFNRWAYGSLIVAEFDYRDNYYCILESEDDVHPMDWPYLDGFIGTFDGKATTINPETVGQWTGLVDENGIKIFEGDIVRTEFGRICVVQWFSSPGYCGWDLSAINTVYNINCTRPPHPNHLFASRCLKVIGNKWDNPELSQ